jgi:hypothetical protein
MTRGSVNHGLSGTRVFRIWMKMRERCYDPNHKHYNNYGGRGIAVCDEWQNDVVAFIIGQWLMAIKIILPLNDSITIRVIHLITVCGLQEPPKIGTLDKMLILPSLVKQDFYTTGSKMSGRVLKRLIIDVLEKAYHQKKRY